MQKQGRRPRSEPKASEGPAGEFTSPLAGQWLDRLVRALDERVAFTKLAREALDERIPGGASFAFALGSATLILFLVQLVTGLVLALYYSPSSTDAWASVAYLEREIDFGALVRGTHHHAAGAMVAVAALHMIQVAFYGAYKRPREANWISGLMLLGLVLGFALTGYLLPWDQTGYWATKVATSIMGTVPILGAEIQRVAQGGNDYGNLTLTRFYALHVVLLPLLTCGLIGVHLALFRKHGVTPHPARSEAELSAREERFWPKQIAYDAMFAVLVLAVVMLLARKDGAPLEAPADPASNFIARPEWYFLFLFQLLKYFEGPLQVIGTVVLPGVVAVALLFLPFLDRGPSRRFRDRVPWLGALAIGMAAVTALTALAVVGDRRDPRIAEQKILAAREASRARALASRGVPSEGAAHMMSHDPLTRGERVFHRECGSCHVLEGRSPEKPVAPELTGYGTKAWIRQVLRDPDSPRLFGRTRVEGMKSFAHLPPAELEALVEFVVLLEAPDPPASERPGYELLEKHECTGCHDFEDWYGVEGPALFRYQSSEWIGRVIADAGNDALYGEMDEMPAFLDRLSDTDRAALVVFLESLGERADRSRWPFVDDPGPVPTPRTSTRAAP